MVDYLIFVCGVVEFGVEQGAIPVYVAEVEWAWGVEGGGFGGGWWRGGRLA